MPTFGVIVLALVAIGCGSSPKTEVADSLAARYPSTQVRHSGALYFERGSTIERMRLPSLEKSLPGVRLFRTTLQTGYFEYPEVEVAVAMREGKVLSVCCSPMFADVSAEFIDLLKEAMVPRGVGERAVADDISSLTARITYHGHIASPRLDGHRYSAELWQDDQKWRLISIAFEDSHVVAVELSNPRRPSTLP